MFCYIFRLSLKQSYSRNKQTKMAHLLYSQPSILLNEEVLSLITIEGFGGKRALGSLPKSELCQKLSKFCMQFCLRVSNNVLHVFSLKFASFLRYYVCKKPHFPRASSGDLLLNEIQKKPFVSLSHYSTLISYYCFVSTSG